MTATTEAPTGTTVVDELSPSGVAQAWERTAPALSGSVKARFAAARFVGVEAGAAVLALPNEMHRQRCEELRSTVEAALSDRFGGPVPVRLVVDDAPPPPADTGPLAPPDLPDDPEEAIDLDSLVDAPAVPVQSGGEKLLEAFPGAELVEENP